MADTALIVIDIQNDYFPGGAMQLEGADAAAANAGKLVQKFRSEKLPIIHVRHLSVRPGATFFLPGTKGAEIHAAVTPGAGEALITKHFPNGFRETNLLEALRGAGASKLVITGMMTHMCVDTTVRAAADLGFECRLAQDGCATRALQFSGQKVEAGQVQLAYLAALNGAFAKVESAEAIAAAL